MTAFERSYRKNLAQKKPKDTFFIRWVAQISDFLAQNFCLFDGIILLF
jgi:hypothetical protein